MPKVAFTEKIAALRIKGQGHVQYDSKSQLTSTRLPSDVILIREISAGVPMKLPIAPAVTPMAAFLRNDGGLPCLWETQVPANNMHTLYSGGFYCTSAQIVITAQKRDQLLA